MSKLVEFPTSLPTIPIPHDTNGAEVVGLFASRLKILKVHDFKEDAVWRDTFALTGTSRTFYTAPTIVGAWHDTNQKAKAGRFNVDSKRALIIRSPYGPHWIQAWFSFETDALPQTTCTGIITLVLTSCGEWRIWTLRTILEQLQGQQNVDILKSTDITATLRNGYSEESHFDCIVIGGGQAGLSQGGRLKALGISYVVIDKYQEIGDNWKQRYGSARCKFTLLMKSRLRFG
jgi:hypothetical protein